MKRVNKSNRVSWAPEANLRQLRFFQQEECPNEVGVGDSSGSSLMASNMVVNDGSLASSNRRTPMIPLTPIEEEEEIEFLPNESPMSVYFNPQPPNLLHNQSTVSQSKPLPSSEASNPENFDPLTILNLSDPAVAAAVAATAIMKLADPPESLIDPELLVKFLQNPRMTEKLFKDQGSIYNPDPLRGKFLNPIYSMATSVSTMVNPLGLNFNNTEVLPTAPQPFGTSVTGTSFSPLKDMNYMSSLVRQYGEPGYPGDASLSQKEKKPQPLNPCVFHFSSVGCRHGSYCLFSHDMPNSRSKSPEEPSPKRMKLGPEFIWRTNDDQHHRKH